MSEREKIQYHLLEPGYDFPPARYRLDAQTAVAYCQAVEEPGDLYQETGLVPPMAVAAYAMAAMAEDISLPPGTIHVSQELEFLDTVTTGDTLTSYAKVVRKKSRGGFQMLTVGLDVVNQERKPVLAGKTSFVLPEAGDEKRS